jgi:uncharacterized protein (TIGR03435 family)
MKAGTVLVAALLVSPLVSAQGQVSFDAASIKQNKSGTAGAGLDMSRGQVRATNLPLNLFLRQAFEVMDSQIVDAPGWVATDRWDIVAKAPEGATRADALRPLMRQLLADRFKLVTRREQREMPVYTLVRANADGSFGPNLRTSPIDCAANNQPAPAGSSAPKTATWDDWLECSVMISPGAINLGGYRMTEVTRILSTLVGRTVIDGTGITAAVQFKLRFQPAGRGGAPPASDAAGDPPNIFTAVQEQAGLRLEARRAPVDVLVIERIERATED